MSTKTMLVGVIALMWASVAWGQRRDFYDRNGVALYNPEIGIVATGPLLIVSPIVSADRKYVTIGMRTTLTQVVSIQNFPVATFGLGGFVGGIQPAPVNEGPANATRGRPANSRPGDSQSPLNQRGIRWIAPP